MWTRKFIFQIDSESEEVEWLNLILKRFWAQFEPTLSDMIKTQVNAVLELSKPGFIVMPFSLFDKN